MLEGFEDSTPLDDLEHYRGRLKETLDKLISLDDAFHDLLPDKEYEEDINTCEEYIGKTKRAIQKASRRIDKSVCFHCTIKLQRTDPANGTGPYRFGLTSCEYASNKNGTFQRRCGNLVSILGAVSVVHRRRGLPFNY